MKALIRITQSSYQVGDIVSLVPDSHTFAGNDIRPGVREEINFPDLSESDQGLLMMTDEKFNKSASILKIPGFRHALIKQRNLTTIRRRKYKLSASNMPEIKP